MSELSQFLPGLLSSVKETRSRAAEYQRRVAKKKAGAPITAAKTRGAGNRQKVLDALILAGAPIGPTPAIAKLAGISYNAASDHLKALVADGVVARETGRGGGFFVAGRNAE
ncbi:MAG TPA: hypothetical protein VFH22_01865 [Rhodocyclaceae bacterium]|nr:hypothetical protein [Rhodocyclaceae bacterium]